jgi:hypothetical protein
VSISGSREHWIGSLADEIGPTRRPSHAVAVLKLEKSFSCRWRGSGPHGPDLCAGSTPAWTAP